MLNTYYSKLLKLSFVVLLATVYIIGFTGNTSYASVVSPNFNSWLELVEMLHEKGLFDNETDYQTAYNYFNYANSGLVRYWNRSDMPNGTIAFFKTSNEYYFYLGYTNNYNRPANYLVNTSFGIQYSQNKSDYNQNNIAGTNNIRITHNNTTPSVESRLININNVTYGYIERPIYINNTLMYEPFEFPDSKLFPTIHYEKVNSRLDYNQRYINLGYIEGEELYTNRVRAELFDSNLNLIGSWHMHDNEENGLLVRRNNYNLEDQNIYLYILSSYIYQGNYTLYLFYDNEDNLAWEINYTFSLSSGDSGYTSQNSTNDIIQNQNQNTDNIVNAIESGNNFINAPLDLSGENITSGDIIGALDMNFSGDPYQNVWVTLIDGLRNCLVGVDREFDIEINNRSYTISLDSFSIKLPAPLKTFLSLVSTTFMLWVLIRWIKLSIDKVQTANIDNLLQQNEEERHN